MEKNFKRFLSWLMVLAMVLSMMPTSVFATESDNELAVAQVGETKYATLQAAVKAADDGETITVIADHELTWDGEAKVDGLPVFVAVEGKPVTIDLNGKKITGNSGTSNNEFYAAFAVDNDGKLTLKDSVGGGSVKITGNYTMYSLLMAYEYGENKSTNLTVEGGSYYLENAHDCLIYCGQKADDLVNIQGGTFELGNVGTGENGKPWIFNVYGAGDNSACVTGGTFNANVQRQFWANEVKVPETHYVENNGDSIWTVKDGATLYVKEGILTGPFYIEDWSIGYASLEAFIAAANADPTDTIDLGDPVTLVNDASTYKADGYKLVSNGDDTWTVHEANYVAEVNGTYYESLKGALEACTNGETVKLIADITYGEEDIVPAHGGATGFGNYDKYNPSIIYIGGTKGATAAENQPSNVNAVLDLNGYAIVNNADAYMFLIMDNAKVTFTDSVGTGSITTNTETPVIWVTGTDTLVTIEGGKYTTDNAGGLLWSTHAGDLVITGGEFSTTADDASLLIVRNERDRNNANYFISGKATVAVTGGTYHGFNPEVMLDDSTTPYTEFNAVPFGYKAVENEDGSWTVKEAVYVAQIGETKYETLSDAITAANAIEGGAVVELLKNVTLGENLTVTGNVTIKGDYTITRADDYTGTLFTVPAGATLTLDGDLTIDGGNNYVFNAEKYADDLADWENPTPTEENAKWFTPEEGAPVATAYMIITSGTVNLNNVTIKNHYSTNGSGIVSASKGAVVTLTGAQITHNASTSGSGLVVNASAGVWSREEELITVTMNEGTVIDGNHVGGNHGVFKIYMGTYFTMNGGEIKNTTGWNSNGVAVGIYHAVFTMNGGTICSNSSEYGPNNGRNAAVYGHSNHLFTMNGGTICHNTGRSKAGIDSPYSETGYTGLTVINGGNVLHNTVLGNWSAPDVSGGETLTITGGTFSQDVTEYCADGYYARENDNGTWTVINYVVWLKAQLLAGNDVKLDRDIVISSEYVESIPAKSNGYGKYGVESGNGAVFNVIGKEVTFDLNGHSITFEGHDEAFCNKTVESVFYATDEAKLTIVDSSEAQTGTVTVNGMATGAYSVAVNTQITIEGGTWVNNPCEVCGAYNLFLYASHGGELYINGGDFTQNVPEGEDSYLIVKHGSSKETNANSAGVDYDATKVVVSGGTFRGMNPEEAWFCDNANGSWSKTNVVVEGKYAKQIEANVWTVINYVCWNVNTGTYYTTVSQALTAAQSGEKVELLQSTSEENVVVKDGITLDLNGYALTAGKVVGFKASHIIDSSDLQGRLVTGKDDVVLNKQNAMLPVYDGDAYVFAGNTLSALKVTSRTDTSVKLSALPAPVMAIVERLKDGAADNNLEICIRLTWSDGNDGTNTMDLTFNEETIKSVYSSNKGSQLAYGSQFYMVITGLEGVSNMKANVVIKSGTGAECVSSKTLQIVE